MELIVIEKILIILTNTVIQKKDHRSLKLNNERQNVKVNSTEKDNIFKYIF